MFKTFRGGVHPEESKHFTMDKAIEVLPPPSKVIIPVSQHIGSPGIPVVKTGDLVKKGQLLAKDSVFTTSWIHSSISGKVIDIGVYDSSYKGRCLSIVIESDGLDEWAEGLPMQRDWEKLTKEEIHQILRESGVVGMGGANFPAHVKLSYGPEKKIDTFIINCSECEPFLNGDYRTMIEYTDRVLEGAKICMKSLGVSSGFVGIENNKPEAVKVLTEAFKGMDIEVVPLKTKYPQGAERMIIKALTGREIPSGKRHSDIGIVGLNVCTVVAVADAVSRGIPLIERVVTVAGDALKEPKNLLVRIGTPFSAAVDFCGGLVKEPEKIINGGPMMGYAQVSLDVPVVKGVSGILAMSRDALPKEEEEGPCIRCGKCVEACPIGLIPSMLSILGELEKVKEAKEDYGLQNCIECGSCAYTCPAKRNILHYIRFLKEKNWALSPHSH
ncbi:MAG: electron transport complex subunit RsxC [Clostridiales bacterium]|nr:electron transport complex subunit RsxC [Clostridiales bacterium]